MMLVSSTWMPLGRCGLVAQMTSKYRIHNSSNVSEIRIVGIWRERSQSPWCEFHLIVDFSKSHFQCHAPNRGLFVHVVKQLPGSRRKQPGATIVSTAVVARTSSVVFVWSPTQPKLVTFRLDELKLWLFAEAEPSTRLTTLWTRVIEEDKKQRMITWYVCLVGFP